MKAKFQIPALLFACAALSAANVSAQPEDMIAWHNEQSESLMLTGKDALISKTIFLDNCLNKTSVSKAEYYQTIQPAEANQVLLKTYFGTGELKMVGKAQKSDDLILHGNFVFYYQNGIVESRGKYTDGIKDGIWERFAPNGEVKAERIYTGKPVEHYFETPAYKVNYETSGVIDQGVANQSQ